jgi:hypothetical protein
LDFTPRPDSVDGHAHQCKTCRNAKIRTWQKSNWERVKENKARYYATDKGKAQKRRSDAAYVNTGGRAVAEAKRAAMPLSEARKAARKKWAKNNTAYLHAQTLYRRALARNLPDFDLWVLREAVLLAKQREVVVGGKWHVDHITPVSKGGSSAHTNVQVVPALWNRRKSNKHANKFFGA